MYTLYASVIKNTFCGIRVNNLLISLLLEAAVVVVVVVVVVSGCIV